MSGPATLGIHHIALVTGDARHALWFYRDVLGLHMVWEGSDAEGARQLVFADEAGSPGTILTVTERPHAGRGRWGIGGVHHLALGTASEETLLQWKRRLADLGIRASGPYDRGYFTSLYFADPDGQVLEIATEGPGYAIDEAPDALGRELLLPPQRIVRGHRDEAAIAALIHPEPVPRITPAMRLRGIHHVSGLTDDLDRAGEFFEAALGLRLVKKTVNRDDPSMLHYFWATYDGRTVAPHSEVTLFGWPSSYKHTRAGIGQTHAVAFRAHDEEDLRAWHDRVLSLGVEASPVLDRGWSRSFHFHAPDGQRLEIATDLPGFGTAA